MHTEPQIDPLTRRPKATTYRVRDVVELVSTGRIRIPRFQRPLRWGASDRQLLFDSIYRGYPVGTVLLWRRPAEGGRMVLGPIVREVEGHHDALWVIDGQQRIATLAACLLLGPDDPAYTQYALFFDLERREVTGYSRNRGEGPRWLPLHRILSQPDLSSWVVEQGLAADPARAQLAFQVGDAIRDYELPAVLVDTDDERTLRQVFERTNTAGKRLRAAEIFQALHVGLSGEQPSTISDFVEEIAELGYGWLDEDTVRHAALAIAGQDPLRRTPAADRFPGAREGLVAAAIAPIKRALSFLAEDAEIPSVEVLPYTLPVSVLAALFARFPHVHERNRLLLVRWLWRGILSGNLAGSPVGKARAAYRTVQAGANESQTVQTLLSQVPKVRSQVPSFADRFKLSSAATRVLLSCSWSLEPVNLSAFLDRDERIAVRPGDLLGSTPGGPGSVRDALRDLPALGGLVMAGARLLTPLPSGDVFSHLRSVVEKAPELLASHGFDQTAVTLLRAGASAEEVCGARVAHLDDVLRRFTERLARWEEDDRPPLAPLLDEGAAYPWLDELL